MPYLVRENLFIGNIGDAAEILQNGPIQNQHHVAHIFYVLNSASISFFSEWCTGLSSPTKEITKVYIGDLAAGTAGPDLKLVRKVVPLKDTENGNLLGYLREKKVSFCLITVSPEFPEGFCLSLASVPRWREERRASGSAWFGERNGEVSHTASGETVMQELWKFSTAA